MIVIIFILSTISFALTVIFYRNKKDKVKKRISQFLPSEEKIAERHAELGTKRSKLAILKNIINTIAKRISTSEIKRNKLEKELESADIPLKVEEFITIRVVLFALALIIPIVFGLPLLGSIIIGFVCWKLPSIFLKKRKESRVAAGAVYLPQTLETMSSAMKSGFSFMQAMQLVSREVPDPIGTEFQRTINEINLGISTEEAFANLLQRLPNKDLEVAIQAILIQRSTGGNLATILETIQETITERIRMKDELKALTSQGRMSALVITLLPIGLGLVLNVMNPGYFTPMLSHPLGLVLLGGGVVSGLFGWLFIKKVVTIEV
ncbi:type II secretion system F family protein [Evansella tamaricis]|uniref:Type II secretion system F family protein n=1 Tax=Evansella tamaricis TaxID=2069301 RepID=A0ABS6JEH7_9BACI|nr:type II secretion system F family protein [Evansella tamaricis]MBU9711579.1 type II secretion system F family protein [Evansella tamaricis]